VEKSRIGYDDTRMPAYYLRYLQEQLPGVEFVPADSLFWKIRAVKTPEEIGRLCKAFDIATRVYRETFAMMKPGVMLEDIQRMQQARASELGGLWYFDHLWVHTPGEPWDPPRDYRLRKGDEGGCDLGVYVAGYGCDFGRTVSLGPVHPEVRAEYDTLRVAYDAMHDACRVGNTSGDVVRAAQKVEKELRGGRSAGCLGHGLGLEVHESPAIMKHWDEPIEENMVIQIEVGDVSPPRNTFVFLEDAGVVTKDGWQPMTDLERDVFVVG
jgi:Xaa-Pro aminopeptidase